jgi:hypothetical protein
VKVLKSNSLLWPVVTLLVIGAWLINFVLQAVVAGYRSDPSINGLMMTVVGGLVALQVERAELRRKINPPESQPTNETDVSR